MITVMKFLFLAILSLPVGLINPFPTGNFNRILSPNLEEINFPENQIISDKKVQDSALTMGQATDLITRWLEAKNKIFADPFDLQLVSQFTTGSFYADTLRAIAFLTSNQAYYKYGVQKIESVEKFASTGNRATIEVKVTEEVTFYQKDKIENSSFNTQRFRYNLEGSNGVWKIAESKAIE